jgi:prepilin-type N-terminal cleavage/methylation domain-containing protein
MNLIDQTQPSGKRISGRSAPRPERGEHGFTLIETAVALVIMMIIALGAASLFAYATMANSGATDREMSMAIAQKRMEWLRNMPFSAVTRNLAYSFPNGGLGATGGVEEIRMNAGRSFDVLTVIQDIRTVPAGQPDAGQPTVKTITITVTPQGVGPRLGGVTLSAQRSTLVPGNY